MTKVKNDPAVILALGEPVEQGFLFSGNIRLVNSSGWADLSIPFSGPKASANAQVRATKNSGPWHFNRLIVTVNETGQVFDLSDTSIPQSEALEK